MIFMSFTMSNLDEIFCSVVLPVYNGEKYLRTAVKSILTQTHKNFELIVIDNCSTDASIQIVNSFSDYRIKIIRENDCHQVSAYNKGFLEARGDYIFIFDQDDFAEPIRFAEQLKHLLNTKSDICGSFINIIDNNGLQIGKQTMPVNDDQIKKQLLYKNYTIFNSSVCIKKKVFEDIGYFKKKYFPSADYEFYLRAVSKFNFSNVPQFLYSWRIHTEQISTKHSKMVRKKTTAISLKYLSKFRSDYYCNKGNIFYYNNYLSKAFYYYSLSIMKEKCYRHASKYLTIIFFFGLPIKVFRFFKLTHSKIFLIVKQQIEFIFGDTERKVK